MSLSSTSTRFRDERGDMQSILLIGLGVLSVLAIAWVAFAFLGQSHHKTAARPASTEQSRFNKFMALPAPNGMYGYWLKHTAGASVKKMTTEDKYAAYKTWLTNNPQKAQAWWVRQMNLDARLILDLAVLDASNYFTHHGSTLDGFTPTIAQRWWKKHLKVKNDRFWLATGSVAPSTYVFDTAQTAEIGSISIRVAHGRQLLFVTRSQTDTPYCGVVSPAATGVGVGDPQDVNACTIIWSAGP
ncbi:MAG TPA: hypothetical protein VEM41_08075 [Actinomycetota bacterium]|nr:hypothetical protein [Actinomycetota bacterium]